MISVFYLTIRSRFLKKNIHDDTFQDYSDVHISNFTTSWSDGLAFIALIHRFRPDLYDYEIVGRKPPNARLDYAFRMANKHLGIARLLDPEGFSFFLSLSQIIVMVDN